MLPHHSMLNMLRCPKYIQIINQLQRTFTLLSSTKTNLTINHNSKCFLQFLTKCPEHLKSNTAICRRSVSTNPEPSATAGIKLRNRNTLYYLSALVIMVSGGTYASVLLYRLYCQSTGSGQAVKVDAGEQISAMKTVKDRMITVKFNADVNSTMRWNFRPQQSHVKVSPGETALAFYTAINPTDKTIRGVATYNVVPFEAGRYFHKIQCFCFEEQQLNPHEEVDMPVFFYLDPEYAKDRKLDNYNEITLSYTFFEAKEGMHLPMPSFV